MPKKGYKQTETHKQHISEAELGKHVSDETKQKMSDNHPDVSGENNPMWGKHHTEESKQKVSDNHADVSGENSPMYGKGYLLSGEKNGMFGKKGKDSPMYGTKRPGINVGEKNGNWKGGYEKWKAKAEEKRRGFGFVPLNDNFIGAERHHLDKELVLSIPRELHRSVYHNVHTGQGMEEINNLACEYVYGISIT